MMEIYQYKRGYESVIFILEAVGILRSDQSILVITIHCNIEGKGSLLRFLIFYYSHSLTGMAPIELYAVSSPHILPSIVRSIIEHSGNIPNIRCSET